MSGEASIRAFICFEISERLRTYLAQIIEGGRKLHERVSWTRPGNIHLTLKFLGNITEEQRRGLEGALAELAATQAPFSVRIDRLGAFPNFRRPRVFWAGSSAANPQLVQFAAQVERAAEQFGFAREERPFTPHLTIGRAKSPSVAATVAYLRNIEFEPHEFACKEVILMRSRLHPQGAIYEPLKRCSLQP